MKKVNRKTVLWTVLLLAVVLVACSILSYLYPSSKFGYRTLLIDNKTNYYGQNTPFRYSEFEFTISPTFENIETAKKDCPANAKSRADYQVSEANKTGLFRFTSCFKSETNQQCWQREYDSVLTSCESENKYIDENELLDVQINIKNASNRMQSINKNWFTVEVDGKAIDVKKVNFYFKDNVGPDESVSNALNFEVSKKSIVRITTTLPNRSPQIIKIDRN